MRLSGTPNGGECCKNTNLGQEELEIGQSCLVWSSQKRFADRHIVTWGRLPCLP